MKKHVAKLKRSDVLSADDIAWEDKFIRDNHAMIKEKLQEAHDSVARGEEPVLIESLEHLLLIVREHRDARLKKNS